MDLPDVTFVDPAHPDPVWCTNRRDLRNEMRRVLRIRECPMYAAGREHRVWAWGRGVAGASSLYVCIKGATWYCGLEIYARLSGSL